MILEIENIKMAIQNINLFEKKFYKDKTINNINMIPGDLNGSPDEFFLVDNFNNVNNSNSCLIFDLNLGLERDFKRSFKRDLNINNKVYKCETINNISNLRIAMIFPGDLCGCRTIFSNDFMEVNNGRLCCFC